VRPQGRDRIARSPSRVQRIRPAFYLVDRGHRGHPGAGRETPRSTASRCSVDPGRDGLPARQLGSRGDRLAYSNGILHPGRFAIVLIIAFNAEVTG
jgi:hypothetical protein